MDPPDSQADGFVQAVAEAIDSGRLIAPGAAVVVGVSGGADSVALLAALRELAGQSQRKYRLIVAHLHHGLRVEADQDERFVAELSQRWGLPCETRRCDVAAAARARRAGIESTARRLRYDFLLDVARRHGASCVAVGHHADDQVETVLFRLFRGSHLRGLAGMAPARSLGEGVRLVRPLLGLRRGDVEAYCRRSGLTWCTDHTNADPAFGRNFIRHELLPLLRRRFGEQVERVLLDLAATAGQTEAYLRGLGQSALLRAAAPTSRGESAACTLALSALRVEAPLVRRYALREALEQAGVPMRAVTAEHLHRLAALGQEGPRVRARGGAAVDLPGGWSARRDEDRVVLIEPSATRARARPQAWPAVALACPGRITLPDGRIVVCDPISLDRRAFGDHCRTGRGDVEWLDADTLHGALAVRPRQRGDAFRPLGSPGRRKLGKLLTDLKLPGASRRALVCVCDEAGIVACLPLRIDERVKITDATRRVLRITLLDAGASRG